MTGTAQQRAIIIGAGIGGLTAALALAGKGWDVQVMERTPELKPVGYALAMAPNAQRALDAIPGGIVAKIHALAALQGDGGIRNARGAWLSRNDSAVALERYGHPFVVVRRAELVGMLHSLLPQGYLRLGTAATAVNADDGGVTLDTGEVLRGDLVVAADGIHSRTRPALFPGHPAPAFAGLTAWQAVIAADGVGTYIGTTWSSGGEFGMLPMTDGWLYVFAEAAVDAPMLRGGHGDEKAELTRRFGHLYAPIPDVIARIDGSSILRTDIHTMRVPLPSFHVGKVAILGDAAHAMAPNLGQGACQAIEDAVTLAYCVTSAGTVGGGLADYTAARLPRTSLMVRRSEALARLATARHPLARALRNGLLRAMGLLGPSAALRQADFVMRWDHPAVSGTPAS
ncbi:FAD-dependent monooxygenase [Arthrobacter sp. HMWF013]|uniref:FAD-dependent monooxygenase n=1 Tax=Arthrobacter sp. HMWF013 TaxID=2056849 RepID=UPI000D3B8CCF|nr:FAD-dependent monooxygenase [Arthrobacter sp. HMWF013]PTT68820.1 monooxygenase [Arthrobacter sp. HMWF013]